MGVADSRTIASAVDGVHDGESTADAKGEAEEESKNGRYGEAHAVSLQPDAVAILQMTGLKQAVGRRF